MHRMQNFEAVENCVTYLKKRITQKNQIPLGIILGTGLSGLTDSTDAKDTQEIPYSEIPGFPCSSVESHKGSFIITHLHKTPVIFGAGRCHIYEGWSCDHVCMGVRVMHGLGVRTLIITNAAGAINPQFETDRLMCITDHINLMGTSPLLGQNNDKWGLRFPDMSEVYDKKLRELALKLALAAQIPLYTGVYVGVHGPELDTPAETRMYRIMGGDAVGMSTVLEVIAAKHLGMRILGLSSLTNKNLPDCMSPVTLQEVIDSGARIQPHLLTLLRALADALVL